MVKPRGDFDWHDESRDGDAPIPKGGIVRCGELGNGARFYRAEREVPWAEIRREYHGVHKRIADKEHAFEAFEGRMRALGHWSHHSAPEQPAPRRRMLSYGRAK